MNKQTETIITEFIKVDSKSQEVNLFNIKNSESEVISKLSSSIDNTNLNISNLHSLTERIMKVSVAIKDDVTMDKMLIIQKENKEEILLKHNNIKELLDAHSEDRATK